MNNQESTITDKPNNHFDDKDSNDNKSKRDIHDSRSENVHDDVVSNDFDKKEALPGEYDSSESLSIDIIVGRVLQEEREGQNYTRVDIANLLKLTTSIVESIELGKLGKIQTPTFVKGYIRSYSQLLKISNNSYISEYLGLNQSSYVDNKNSKPLKLYNSEKTILTSVSSTSGRTLKSSRAAIYIVFALLLGIGVFLVTQYFYSNYALDQIRQIQTVNIDNIFTDNVEDHILDDLAYEEQVSDNLNIGVIERNSFRDNEYIGRYILRTSLLDKVYPNYYLSRLIPYHPNQYILNIIPQRPSIINEISNTSSSSQVNTQAIVAKVIEMSFTQESWIQISSVDNNGNAQEVIDESTHPAGTSYSISVTEPVSIIIGNSEGTNIEVDDSPVSFSVRQDNNVGRLIVR